MFLLLEVSHAASKVVNSTLLGFLRGGHFTVQPFAHRKRLADTRELKFKGREAALQAIQPPLDVFDPLAAGHGR